MVYIFAGIAGARRIRPRGRGGAAVFGAVHMSGYSSPARSRAVAGAGAMALGGGGSFARRPL